VTIPGAKRILCQIASDLRVGQPADSFSSDCSLCCSDRIGTVVNVRGQLDVALIQLVSGLDYLDEVKGDAGTGQADTAITGTHTVTSAEQVAAYPVNKRGAVTLYTSGTVDALNVSGYATNSTSSANWVIFYRFYESAMFVVGNGGAAFSDQGDSGSPVFNNNGEIVGLLFAGSANAGRSVVTPIDQIVSSFGVTVVTATGLGQKQTVSAAEGVSTIARVDAAQLPQAVREAQEEMSSTAFGQELTALVRTHAQEVQTLINCNHRVATAWRRNSGPQILNNMLRFLQERNDPIAEPPDGPPITDRLSNIQRSLSRHGSKALAADLERYGPEILPLTRLGYPEMIARMNAGRPPAPGP
jgi:hypothetical protein